MTQQADLQPVKRDHGCQTPECPNDFAVIITRVDEGTSEFLCDGCNLAFQLAVLQQMAADGTIVLPASVTQDQPASPASV